MAPVRVVVVEDRFEGLGGVAEESVGADVKPSVGEGGEDFEARRSKGSITASA